MNIIKSRKLQIIAALLLIAGINLYGLSDLYAITIVNDEFGYVGMAAQMAGYDWTNLLSTSQYYSYGYGIILSLLFRIGLTGTAFFRAAIVLNVVLLEISFLITCYLADKMFDCKWNVMISLAINLYSCNLMQCKLCWSETILYFLVWVWMLLIYQLSIKYDWKYLLGIVVVSIYMYTVHQRCLSVIVATVGMVLILLVNGHLSRNNKCKALLTLLFMIVLFLAVSKIKGAIIDNWYRAESTLERRIAVNDYGGQVNKVKQLVNIKMLVCLIFGMMGKLWAQAAASGMLILFALVAALKSAIQKIVGMIREKRILKLEQQEIIIYAATLLFLGAWMVASIYKVATLSNQKYSVIIMTRYIDYIAGPMLLTGFCILIHYKDYLKDIIFSFVVMVGLTIVTYFQFTRSYQSLFVSINIASIYPGVKNIPNDLRTVLVAGAAAMLFALILLIIMNMGIRKGNINLGIGIVSILVMGIFAYNGAAEAHYFTGYKQEEVVEYLLPVIDYMEERNWNGTIYYVREEDNYGYNFLKILQFMLPEQKIELVEESEIPSLAESRKKDLLLVGTEYREEFMLDAVEEGFVMDTGRICVYNLDR
ncbi:MAG: hypothetical protein HDR23_09780 [Lachnospiraceae bacterium]|nr:hypothetical protein [Lachnospiraceae bacterium]